MHYHCLPATPEQAHACDGRRVLRSPFVSIIQENLFTEKSKKADKDIMGLGEKPGGYVLRGERSVPVKIQR
jgi:hypothetical protein